MRVRALMAGLALAVSLTAGCGSDEPSVEDKACTLIKDLTPGVLETQWNVATLADPKATQQQRLAAMTEQLDANSGRITYRPYRCEGPVWERFLAEYRQR